MEAKEVRELMEAYFSIYEAKEEPEMEEGEEDEEEEYKGKKKGKKEKEEKCEVQSEGLFGGKISQTSSKVQSPQSSPVKKPQPSPIQRPQSKVQSGPKINQMNSYEPEGEIVEGRALGTANKKSSDTNPKGSNLRASSGRGGTFTKAGGLGKKKTFKNNPDGDDMVKSMYDKQAKDDRREAARQRAAEKKVVRIVKNSYELEGEQIDEIKTATTTSGDRIPDFENDTKAKQVPGLRVNKPQKPVDEGYKRYNNRRVHDKIDKLKSKGDLESIGRAGQIRDKLIKRSFSSQIPDKEEKLNRNKSEKYKRSKTVSDNTEKKKSFPNRLTRSDKQGIRDSYDYYDIILSHLLDEGYADTNQAALAIMANMSEEWRESIVEMNLSSPLFNRPSNRLDRKPSASKPSLDTRPVAKPGMTPMQRLQSRPDNTNIR
jgi:hypothetical protein